MRCVALLLPLLPGGVLRAPVPSPPLARPSPPPAPHLLTHPSIPGPLNHQTLKPLNPTPKNHPGTYVYFDYNIMHDDLQSGWCYRRKENFTFRYDALEDELPAQAA